MTSKTNTFIYGILFTLFCIGFIILTVIFSNQLVKYSGITTFYSLIAIFTIFATAEIMKGRDKKKENYANLRSVKRVKNQIKKEINFAWETVLSQKITLTNIGDFDYELPSEINGKSTINLDNTLDYCNTKIAIINSWREGHLDIMLNPDKKERTKKEKRYIEIWGNNAEVAFSELKKAIEIIEQELKSWLKEVQE